MFSPVVPELLSGSTPLVLLFVDPLAFLGLLVLEMALYGSGVLLVREALVRWRKGWGLALLLAGAYAILEEGFTTILLPHAIPLASPVLYGRWMGVNWIWAAVILQLHIAFSIGAQLALIHLAFPEIRGRPLLTDGGVRRSFLLLLGAYGCFLALAGWVPPWPLALVPLGAIAVLLALARLLPPTFLAPRSAQARWSPRQAALLGFLFPVALVIPEGLTIRYDLPAATGVAAVVGAGALFLALWTYGIGQVGNDPVLAGWVGGMMLVDLLYGFLLDPLGAPLALALALPLLYGLLRVSRTAVSRTSPGRVAQDPRPGDIHPARL